MAIKGQVSGFTSRWEQSLNGKPVWVWDFRIEQQPVNGQAQPRVPVEMRGIRYEGSINNGDWVEVEASWENGKVLQLTRVTNLSSNATVLARGFGAVTRRLTLVISCIFVALVVGFIAVVWIHLLTTPQ